MKLTLAQVRPVVARVLSLAPTDARVADYINEAQERLLHKGKWPGTYGRFTVKVTDGYITWPRQIETIESYAVDGRPGLIRNGWFEFSEAGPGVFDVESNLSNLLADRGDSIGYREIGATPRKLRLITTVAADNGLKILVQGYDEQGVWVRTQIGGVWSDGEQVTLVNAGGVSHKDTVTTFSFVSGVQKPITSGSVQMFLKDSPVVGQDTQMATYEPDETLPSYRRSLIPEVGPAEATVTVVAKMRFIPARVDTDWMMIQSVPALKEMCMSLRKAENNLPAEAQAYEQRAVMILQEYLAHYLGDGVAATPKFANASTFGGGGVINAQ